MTQALLRAGIFLSLVTILGITERRWPQNQSAVDRRHRWPRNVAFGALDVIVVRRLMPRRALDAARWSNVALPATRDRAPRVLFVTPDMPRIHHSVVRAGHDRNFGFHVSWWDRLFGSYLAQAQLPQTVLRLGLSDFRSPAGPGLPALLRQPIRPF